MNYHNVEIKQVLKDGSVSISAKLDGQSLKGLQDVWFGMQADSETMATVTLTLAVPQEQLAFAVVNQDAKEISGAKTVHGAEAVRGAAFEVAE